MRSFFSGLLGAGAAGSANRTVFRDGGIVKTFRKKFVERNEYEMFSEKEQNEHFLGKDKMQRHFSLET